MNSDDNISNPSSSNVGKSTSNNVLKEISEQFSNGTIAKADYITKMHANHQLLQLYS